jgi:thymidylate kinase
MWPVNQRLIIIEGIDCTGKSTVARAIAAKIGNRTALLHAGPPQGPAYDEYVLPLRHMHWGWTVICDRWHLGELVWPAIFDREPIISWGQQDDIPFINEIEDDIRAITEDITCIYLVREPREIAAQMAKRGEKSLDLLVVDNLYEKAMIESTFKWNRMTMPDALDWINEWK